jgi:hypothetical protein
VSGRFNVKQKLMLRKLLLLVFKSKVVLVLNSLSTAHYSSTILDLGIGWR